MGEMWGSEERCREVWGEVWKSIGGSKVWVVGCGTVGSTLFQVLIFSHHIWFIFCELTEIFLFIRNEVEWGQWNKQKIF